MLKHKRLFLILAYMLFIYCVVLKLMQYAHDHPIEQPPPAHAAAKPGR